MKKSLQTIIACLLCVLCVFSVACTKTPTSSSGSASGGSGNIEPDEYYVTEFSVLTPPTKTKYNVGEKFDYSGMRLKAVWNDGEEEEIGAYECDEISPKGALTENVTEMTFEYYGKKTTYPITVEKKEIGSLTIDTSKINLRVVAGSYVNLKDIAVTINYADGRSDAVTDYSLTENGKEVETPSRYLVEAGAHVFTVGYLEISQVFTVFGYEGTSFEFGGDCVRSDLTKATETVPAFAEAANTVKSYKETNSGPWEEIQVPAYSASRTQGITSIKANAVIKIHFYREKASYAKIGLNAATYYLYYPAHGIIYPMELPKLFSSIKLNGIEVDVKNDTLPGGTDWKRVFADVDLCEGFLKSGDNVLELTVDEFYWNSKFQDGERSGTQLYGETVVSIKKLNVESVDDVEAVIHVIAVTKKPTKTVYSKGETFDPAGMEVTAYYNDGTQKIISDYSFDDKKLSENDTEIEITYEGKTTTVNIEVSHEHVGDGKWIITDKEHYQLCSVCKKIKVKQGSHDLTKDWTFTAPTRTKYAKGEKLNLTGMSLTASCSVCGTIDVTEKLKISSLVAPAPDPTSGKARITVTYEDIINTFDITISRIEVVAGWDKSGKPDGSHTSSYFLNKDAFDLGTYSMREDMCASFRAGAKMRFYFLVEENCKANLSFRAGCGAGSVKANSFFDIGIYKLSSEVQDVSEVVREKVDIPDTVRFGGNQFSDWTDFDKEYSVGEVSLQKGWNVVEVVVLNGMDRDFNFKSVILDFAQ